MDLRRRNQNIRFSRFWTYHLRTKIRTNCSNAVILRQFWQLSRTIGHLKTNVMEKKGEFDIKYRQINYYRSRTSDNSHFISLAANFWICVFNFCNVFFGSFCSLKYISSICLLFNFYNNLIFILGISRIFEFIII